MLRDQFTKSFDVHIQLQPSIEPSQVQEFKEGLRSHAQHSVILDVYPHSLHVTVPYKDEGATISNTKNQNFASLIKFLEEQQQRKCIVSFRVLSKDLEGIFNRLIQSNDVPASTVDHHYNGVSILMNGNGQTGCASTTLNTETQNNNVVDETSLSTNELPAFNMAESKPLKESFVIRNLFWKRFMHFKRNFRLILCMLILPTLFEIMAMGFLKLRPPGEYETNLQLDSGLLYPDSEEFYRFGNSV